MTTKLVRDEIPRIIRKTGGTPNCYIADTAEYRVRLIDKMHEEIQEFRKNPCKEEAADMLEVLLALIQEWGWVPLDIYSTANAKRKERGGFKQGCVLIIDDEETEENDWTVTAHGEILCSR